MNRFKHSQVKSALLAVVIAANAGVPSHATDIDSRTNNRPFNLQLGSDLNSAESPVVQPQDPALAGGGRDQSLQFGDVLAGTRRDDLQIGGLGVDVLFGGRGNDVQIGGLEHFNPQNRDRAFGGSGDDIFVWKPGDGSDLFAGGGGHDAVVFGTVGEHVDGEVEFGVSMDQQAGVVAINRRTGLPWVDVSGSPGFCELIDESSSDGAAQALDDLELDDLVRFSIRAVRDDFEAGVQNEDNGLRVTLHLAAVEYLVCTNRVGGEIEVLDLTTSPASLIALEDIRSIVLQKRVRQLVF